MNSARNPVRARPLVALVTLLAPLSCGGEDGEGSGKGGSGGATASGPTWHQDLAPLVAERCGTCHREGGLAPFSLATYADALPLAGAMASATATGAMPPWHALETDECQPPYAFHDDPRLTDDEKALFQAWVDAGSPEGDPATAAPVVPAEIPRLEGDVIDLPLGAGAQLNPIGNPDQFLCFSVDPGFTTETWIDGLEIVPGNGAVVHHVLTYVDAQAASAGLARTDGSYPCFGTAGIPGAALIGGYVPGSLPAETPAGAAFRVPAGARFIAAFHYHLARGAAPEDRSTLRVRRHPTRPGREAQFILIGNMTRAEQGLQAGPADRGAPEFRIPAGAMGHVESMLWAPPQAIPEVRLFAVLNHMHYVGVDMRVAVRRPDGEEQCLLQTPHWDFDWQRLYRYDTPPANLPTFGTADRLSIRCTYDNTLENPGVRRALAETGQAAPADVTLGESSLEEMCLAGVGFTFPVLR